MSSTRTPSAAAPTMTVVVAVVAAVGFAVFTAFGARGQVPSPGGPASAPSATGGGAPAHEPRVFELGDPATSATLTLLREIETRHRGLKTLVAEFQQEKTSAQFEEKIESRGRVYLQMPDRLRCDYENPDPSTVLFVDNATYQVSPTIKQVDQFVYKTKEEAQQQFRLMLLGFGMSSSETLQNYEIRLVDEPQSAGGGKVTHVLVFRPLDPEVSRIYKEFRVWLDDRLLPRKVRYEEVSGDVTLLTIRRILKDDPIKAKVFERKFPKSYEVIEH